MATQAYRDWRAAGSPWDLARPIEDLVAQAHAAGVSVLGTIGNQAHLESNNPEDHTPYSVDAWPNRLPGWVVCAGDFDDGPWSDRLLAACRAGRAPWVKYLNFRGQNYSVRRGWTGRSSGDRHLHVSVRTDHINTRVGGNLFTGETEDDDVELSDQVPGTKTDDHPDRTVALVLMDGWRDTHLDMKPRLARVETATDRMVAVVDAMRGSVDGVVHRIEALENLGVTQEMLEAALSNVLGRLDGVSPAAAPTAKKAAGRKTPNGSEGDGA